MNRIESSAIGIAVVIAIGSFAGTARAEAPPAGWHAGKAPPPAISKVFSVDLAPGFAVTGSLDVPIADLPLAAEGQGSAPQLYIADDLAPFPRDWKAGVHGDLLFTVKAWTGLVRLNDEQGEFGPSTWWSMGVKHQSESTAKNSGPFSFDVLTGFDSLAQYAKPTPAHFDHVEGTVDSDFSSRTSRWLTGEAAPAAWDVARAIRIPGEHGESLAVFVGTSSVVLGGADHDSAAMIFLDDDARAKLRAHQLKGAQNFWKSQALVIDVSSEAAHPIVHFRVVEEPFFF
jgi:hypothetical protein